jgi:tartrate-resistant acid phosphatase type 5
MGLIGQRIDAQFVISTGDNFYPEGLKVENDLAFFESFTSVYNASSLQVQWYASASFAQVLFQIQTTA